LIILILQSKTVCFESKRYFYTVVDIQLKLLVYWEYF